MPIPRRMWQTDADIDVRLALLMKRLWCAGYATRYCCQGDIAGEHESELGERGAYITFATAAEAALFAALAGPFAWDQRSHRQRHQERPAGSERWTWDWLLEGDTVRFPSRDIDRVTAAARRLPRLEELIGALCETPIPHRPAPPACPHCGLELFGAEILQLEAHQGAPRTCLRCGGVIVRRRKEALYCSRKCQLAARDRRGNKPKG
jgi:hypothetical protein